MDFPPVPYRVDTLVFLCHQPAGPWARTHVVVGEVTTLEHELGNDTVERRALIAVSLRSGAKNSEVLGGLGNNIIVQLEGDPAKRLCKDMLVRFQQSICCSFGGLNTYRHWRQHRSKPGTL